MALHVARSLLQGYIKTIIFACEHYYYAMKKLLLSIVSIFLAAPLLRAAAPFVSFTPTGFCLNTGGEFSIYIDTDDERGVETAARNVCSDLNRVCGASVSVSRNVSSRIIAGTLGHSAAIDRMVKKGMIDVKSLRGKTEKFIITTTENQLLIAGSDRRGTIYGLYELARQAGVSPWTYWADAPVVHHDSLYINNGVFTDGEPTVRYRGIFLNDEAPCLTSWVKNTFGTNYGDHRFYARVCELILRLRGNMLWPAMWSWAFYADDPANISTADSLGVIIGTSHHEPMARNHQEWARHRKEYGAWNYKTNRKVLDRFFAEGIERSRGYETMVTIGMRGDGDEAMSEDTDVKLLETIVKNQRDIISRVTKRPADATPQVWALYKEVLDYYDHGLRVPDDVTLLLCDDNWGNLRRVPSVHERKRRGGWGLYYHVDYVGAPRNSKWINATPVQNMWEQLTLASQNGIDRLWILNVGDLKPMEYPIQLFMDMAWNPREYSAETLHDHTRSFCKSLFGDAEAAEAARLLDLCCKMNGRSTAEMLDRTTYNAENGEWRQVADEYMRLEAEALRQYNRLPTEQRDCYEEIIMFPVQAMSNLHQMYFAQAMNHILYKRNDPRANLYKAEAERCFHRDSLLCARYNHVIAQGKWNGMMTQKHIGYTQWNDNFPHDMLPELKTVSDTTAGGFTYHAASGYVAMEADGWHTATDAPQAHWTVIPGMGRTRCGISLQPYDRPTGGASLIYRFTDGGFNGDSIRVHVVVKSTLDYLNQGGLTYSLSLDGGTPVKVNFNKNLNEKTENIYTVYYPTVARRVVESVVSLPFGSVKSGAHTLTLVPNDPAIVFEKIVVDMGWYSPSFLFMPESVRTRQ